METKLYLCRQVVRSYHPFTQLIYTASYKIIFCKMVLFCIQFQRSTILVEQTIKLKHKLETPVSNV